MEKIKRYKLKEGITKEQLLKMGVKEADYYTYIHKQAIMGKGYCADIHFAYPHTGKNGKTKQIKVTSKFDIDIAFTENLQDWNDYDNILVFDSDVFKSDFCHPYYPFYEYLMGKMQASAIPKVLPLLVVEYNRYMDSLEFLEEIKEE